MQVEICANSFESAQAAQLGGASRIELCTELSVGGLTPSHGLIQQVMEELSLEVHVLIRPRSADFNYSEAELSVMQKDIAFCKSMGCHGIVSGALTDDFNLDVAATKFLIQASDGMHFTYHRAFDWARDYLQTFEQLEQLGVNRLLTSGQRYTAVEGLEILNLLNAQSSGVEVMPGGGVGLDNASLFAAAGFSSIHLSATHKSNRLSGSPAVPMHSTALGKEGITATSDAELIKAIVALVS